MLVSALPYVPNKKIVKTLGAIYGKDTGIMFGNFFEDNYEAGKRALIKAATKLGANAVLNVQISMMEEGRIIFFGEAVILEDE